MGSKCSRGVKRLERGRRDVAGGGKGRATIQNLEKVDIPIRCVFFQVEARLTLPVRAPAFAAPMPFEV